MIAFAFAIAIICYGLNAQEHSPAQIVTWLIAGGFILGGINLTMKKYHASQRN